MPRARTTRYARQRRWRILLSSLAVIIAIAVGAAFLAARPHAGVTATAASAVSAGSVGVAQGAFTATTMSGHQVTFPGARPSVLFFFATTCTSCVAGAQAMVAAQSSSGGANFVAVDVDPNETAADIQGFLVATQSTGLAYVSDSTGRLTRSYAVTDLSTVVVLDASGRVVDHLIEPSAAQIQADLTKV